MSLDIPLDQLARLRVERNGTGAIDDAVGDDCLVVDAGERLGGLLGEDRRLDGGHGGE